MGMLSLLFYLSLHLSSAGSASKEYVIYKGDEVIGTIKASENRLKDSTHYKVTSSVTYHSLLYNMERETITNVSFGGGKMATSKAYIEKNGAVEENCHTLYKGGNYYCVATNGDITQITEKIGWCTSMLYFKEPTNASRIFAEAYQAVCPIKKTATPHVYELTLPGNKKNEYVYKNGQLAEVKVHRTLVNLSFKPKP